MMRYVLGYGIAYSLLSVRGPPFRTTSSIPGKKQSNTSWPRSTRRRTILYRGGSARALSRDCNGAYVLAFALVGRFLPGRRLLGGDIGNPFRDLLTIVNGQCRDEYTGSDVRCQARRVACSFEGSQFCVDPFRFGEAVVRVLRRVVPAAGGIGVQTRVQEVDVHVGHRIAEFAAFDQAVALVVSKPVGGSARCESRQRYSLVAPASLAPAHTQTVVDHDAPTAAAEVAVAVVDERGVLQLVHVARVEVREADIAARGLPNRRGGPRRKDLGHALADARHVEERVRVELTGDCGRKQSAGELNIFGVRAYGGLTLDEEVHRNFLKALELADAPSTLASRRRSRGSPFLVCSGFAW